MSANLIIDKKGEAVFYSKLSEPNPVTKEIDVAFYKGSLSLICTCNPKMVRSIVENFDNHYEEARVG